MDLLKEVNKLVKIDIQIKVPALVDLVFDKGAMPLLEKVTDLIPTEIDNAYLADRKDDLKVLVGGLILAEISKVQAKIDELFAEEVVVTEAAEVE